MIGPQSLRTPDVLRRCSKSSPGNRRAVVGAVALAVATAACRGGDGAGLRTAHEVRAYRVTYAVSELGLDRDELVVVRRPYESRRTSVRNGAVFNGLLTNDDGLWEWVSGDEPHWRLVDPGRRWAEADARPAGSLAWLLEQGSARRNGTDEVLGRHCEVVRVRDPIGIRVTTPPTDTDHVDLCLDEAGIVLAETWVADGEVVRARRATSVEIDTELDDDEFVATPADGDATMRATGGRELIDVTTETLDSLAVAFDPPSDLHPDRAVAWLHRDNLGGIADASLVRFFRRGADLVEVEERDSSQVSEAEGMTFDTPLGAGSLTTNLRRLSLYVPLADGVTVLVHAPTVDLLEALVGSMRRQLAEAEPGSRP